MKPSERIFQIFSDLRQKKGGNKNEDRVMAVIHYLDEEYEKQDEYYNPTKKSHE